MNSFWSEKSFVFGYKVKKYVLIVFLDIYYLPKSDFYQVILKVISSDSPCY